MRKFNKLSYCLIVTLSIKQTVEMTLMGRINFYEFNLSSKDFYIIRDRMQSVLLTVALPHRAVPSITNDLPVFRAIYVRSQGGPTHHSPGAAL